MNRDQRRARGVTSRYNPIVITVSAPVEQKNRRDKEFYEAGILMYKLSLAQLVGSDDALQCVGEIERGGIAAVETWARHISYVTVFTYERAKSLLMSLYYQISGSRYGCEPVH